MAVGLDGRWHPGIGDPTLVGWVTVGAYALAAALAARAALAAKAGSGSRGSREVRLVYFWGIAAVALLLLGVNKQLDLQSWFTQAIRDLSRQQGWYEERRRYQMLFVMALAGVGLLATLAAAALLRRVLFRIGLALVGMGLLISFVVARAASFHHIDGLLRSGPLPLNLVAEIGSLVLIAMNAWAAGRSRRGR